MCAVEGGQPPCCKSWAAQCLRIGAPAISGISEGTAHSRWLLNSATSRSGTGKEQLPIADCAPSQRRGEFKAGQISLHSVYHLVSCSPIFQSLCPTNRLCSPRLPQHLPFVLSQGAGDVWLWTFPSKYYKIIVFGWPESSRS